MSTYAWVIDKDHLAEPDEAPGTNMNAVGITGPSAAPAALLKRLQEKAGVPFKMYDDDGELYYTGRILAVDKDGDMSYPACDETFLGPLDDYGTPNAGAVCIEYRNPETGEWEAL